MSSSVTGVVFQDNVDFVLSESGSYSVRAKTDLSAGTLVLLEHIVHGEMKDMFAALMIDNNLRDTLYPRTSPPSSDELKIGFNAFSFNGVIVLGNKISKFNHACHPNSFLTTADRVKDEYIYGVWTVAKVKAGEELTLDYMSGRAADLHTDAKAKYGFACDCTENDIKRAAMRLKVEFALANKFRDAMSANGSTANMVDSYMRRGGTRIAKQQKNARELANRIQFVQL
jgi:hypothetical protein